MAKIPELFLFSKSFHKLYGMHLNGYYSALVFEYLGILE